MVEAVGTEEDGNESRERVNNKRHKRMPKIKQGKDQAKGRPF